MEAFAQPETILELREPCPRCGGLAGRVWMPPGRQTTHAKLGCAACNLFLCLLTRPTLKEMPMPADTENVAPPSAPMMTAEPKPEPPDILDPPVPAGTLAPPPSEKAPGSPAAPLAPLEAPETLPAVMQANTALVQGFCQYIQRKLNESLLEQHKGLMQTLDATLVAMRKWVETVGAQNEHSQYTLGDALTKLQTEGLTVIHPPYQAILSAQTPAGYTVTLTLTKNTSGALVEELGRLEGWLQANGYKATEEVRL